MTPLSSLKKHPLPASPPLVVLDAFQTHFLDACDGNDLAPAFAVLALARNANWPVCFVLHRPPADRFDPDDTAWQPIEGLAPSPIDMSFVTIGQTAFASRAFTERLTSQRPHTVLYMSLALPVNKDRTLAEARDRGLSFFLVTDHHIIGACHPITDPYIIRGEGDVQNKEAMAHPVLLAGPAQEAAS